MIFEVKCNVGFSRKLDFSYDLVLIRDPTLTSVLDDRVFGSLQSQRHTSRVPSTPRAHDTQSHTWDLRPGRQVPVEYDVSRASPVSLTG